MTENLFFGHLYDNINRFDVWLIKGKEVSMIDYLNDLLFLSLAGGFRQAKLNRSAGGGESGSLVRMTSASGLQLPVPQSLPHGHGHLSTVSAVSPAHTHHSARLCAPSPSALKLASVASSLDRVPKVTPTSAIDIARSETELIHFTIVFLFCFYVWGGG